MVMSLTVSSGADLVSLFTGTAIPLGASAVAYEVWVTLNIVSAEVMRGICPVLMRLYTCREGGEQLRQCARVAALELVVHVEHIGVDPVMK